jgi:hypothetical protein
MNIKEKLGDFLIDLAKMVIGGVVLSSVISENINTVLLYIIGTGVALVLVFAGFKMYQSKNKEK